LKLGFSVSRTMTVAQRLYESGKITYMRTDSVNLSDTAVNGAKDEIIRAYGQDFSKPTKYKTKSSGAQEAHEAIRPTDFSVHSISGERDEQRLYELIWKRSIASQMSHAELERTIVQIGISGENKRHFTAKGEVIRFEGFLKVYLESTTEEEDDSEQQELLPDVAVGERLDALEITATQRFTRPPSRYVEASLVKKLEELGIGRPSTYAPTISTIQKRGYVEKKEREGEERSYIIKRLISGQVSAETKIETTGKEKNKLSPTDIGILVNDFLMEHFERIMDYHFTAKVEHEFDEIARGLIEWTKMIHDFYDPFHQNVDDTLKNSERVTGERELGIDPRSGRTVIARFGRFGPMIQIGDELKDGEKPLFSSLKTDQSIGTITLDEALELFKLPRELGELEGVVIRVNSGKFGPYVQHGKTFVSIPKGTDPLHISLEEALELINSKKDSDASKVIRSFSERPDVQLLNGRYGPYLKIGKDNFKLPKGSQPEVMTLEECLDIASAQSATNRKGARKK
jgi:DNA topoisomerase-1